MELIKGLRLKSSIEAEIKCYPFPVGTSISSDSIISIYELRPSSLNIDESIWEECEGGKFSCNISIKRETGDGYIIQNETLYNCEFAIENYDFETKQFKVNIKLPIS